jgi:hypothetical protein
MTVAVPEENSLVTATTIRFTVTPTSNAGVVSASSTGAVKLLTSAQYEDAVDVADITTGTQALSEASVGAGNVVFYAYTTSTTAGTLTIANGGNTRTYYVKARVGAAYNVTAKFPATLNSATDSDIQATVTDIFGNAVTGATNGASFTSGTLTAGYFGSSQAGASAGAFLWNSTSKVWVSKVKGGAVAGPSSLSVTLAPTLGDQSVANGLAAPVTSAFSSLSSVDLADQVKALTTQVAALTADYNALAAKWNKKVANKKAPKKKVALK